MPAVPDNGPYPWEQAVQLYQRIAVPVPARQWTPDTDPEELAAWCDGWTYTGTRHGHTTPPWRKHTCLDLETGGDGKGHADPGDWIIRVRPETYLVLSPAEFTAEYQPAGKP